MLVATDATSLLRRCLQYGSCCHFGLRTLVQPPSPGPTLSVQPRFPPPPFVSTVPPLATTLSSAEGYATPEPMSPPLARYSTPLALKYDLSTQSDPSQLQLTETTCAPSLTASATAASRSFEPFELASTRSIVQLGQLAASISTSRSISTPQLGLPCG